MLVGSNTFRDNEGNEIAADADANGQFLLRIPQDPGKPGFLKALEEFIECRDPAKDQLVTSIYLNTTGLRKRERLVGLKVNPAASVFKLIFNNLVAVDPSADAVAMQARLQKDVNTAGLLTQSPTADTKQGTIATGCPRAGEQQTLIDSINIPLQVQPLQTNDSGNRAGMAVYIASQLFLAAFKGDTVDVQGVSTDTLDGFPCKVPLTAQQSDDFHTVLNSYLRDRTVTDGV